LPADQGDFKVDAKPVGLVKIYKTISSENLNLTHQIIHPVKYIDD